MVEWSGGILCSNMRRVTYAPGEQGDVTRYSVAYLVRPVWGGDYEEACGGRIVDSRVGRWGSG